MTLKEKIVLVAISLLCILPVGLAVQTGLTTIALIIPTTVFLGNIFYMFYRLNKYKKKLKSRKEKNG